MGATNSLATSGRQFTIEDYTGSSSDPQEWFTTKLAREAELLLYGVGGAAQQVIDKPLEKAPEVGTSVVFGAGLKALQKAGTPGKVIATTIAGAAAVKMVWDEVTGDRWSTFGGALADNWTSGENFEQNVAATRDSVGALAVDFAVGGVAFKAAGLSPSPVAKNSLEGMIAKDIRGISGAKGEIEGGQVFTVLNRKTNEPVKIVRVTKENVDEAAKAAEDGFSYAKGILNPADDFRASLDPKLAEAIYANNPNRPINVEYWAAIDANGRMVGTTGLYNMPGDKSRYLGWSSVRPEDRGKGYGSLLFDFSTAKAKAEGSPSLKLYTSTHAMEARANEMYGNRGFKITSKEPVNEHGVNILHREKDLRSPLNQMLSSLYDGTASTVQVGKAAIQNTFGTQYRFTTPDIRTNKTWHPIYEAEFPAGERQPYSFLESLAAPGAVPQVKLQLTERTTFIDRLLGREPKTAAFSVTSDYGQGASGSRLLMPYIGVNRTIQSQGIGTQHAANTFAFLKKEYPTAKGMILEMEAIDEVGITAAQLVQRTKRQSFWVEKNGAQLLDDIKYRIPSSEPGQPDIPLKLLMVPFQEGATSRANVRDITNAIYRHGYELADDHPIVKDFNAQFEAPTSK